MKRFTQVVGAMLVLAGLARGDARAQTAAAGAASGNSYDDTRWAILIGVSKYEELGGGLSELRGPGNDARLISDALIRSGRFNPRHVIVLADGAEWAPSRDAIMGKLYEVSRKVKDGQLLFFFAGHGVTVNGQAYLLPSSVRGTDEPEGTAFKTSAIAVADIRSIIGENKVREVVLMVDACRNNPAIPPAARARSVARGATPLQNTALQNGAGFRQAFQWRNSVTIFSTQEGQQAFESGGEPSNGYFAETLARALRGEWREAIDQQGAVTIGSLMDFLPGAVHRRVSQALPGQDQTPQILASIGGRIVLTTPGMQDATSLPNASLRVRMPGGALTRAGLIVANNKTLLVPGTLGAPVPVRPGRQFVEVKLPGYEEWSSEVDVPAGEVTVDVKLQPKRWPMIASLAGAGVGVAAIVTGLAFGAHANSIEAEVTRACGDGSSCGAQWESVYRAKNADGERAATISNVFLVTGGILTAAGGALAAYFHWWRPVLDGGFDVAPGPTHAGLSLVRRW